ncbi:MAG: pseudouridine synthase [Bacillota bacterium]
MEERLQKVLAKAGVASRRHAEELITGGKVKVNGKVITELGTKVNAYKDKIQVNGKPLPPLEQKIYLILNKPRGYVTTLSDERGRKTVVDLLKGVDQRVYPVGRLDYDSEGLLLLTNDGELTQALTHPKHEVKKTYMARVEGIPEPDKLQAMAKGLTLEDGPTAPADVKMTNIQDGRALLQISIHEGRNRQVRRMCEHIGHEVLRLRRTRLGPLELGDLKSGEFRPLTKPELKELMTLAGLKLDVRNLAPVNAQPVKPRRRNPASSQPAGKSLHKDRPAGGPRNKNTRSEESPFTPRAKGLHKDKTTGTGRNKNVRDEETSFNARDKSPFKGKPTGTNRNKNVRSEKPTGNPMAKGSPKGKPAPKGKATPQTQKGKPRAK